jgi:hypothetical protein
MAIDSDDYLTIFNLAHGANSNQRKSLTTKERNAVFKIAQSIVCNSDLPKIDQKVIESIRAKLKLKIIPSQKRTSEKISNFFQKLFGLRHSSKEIERKTNDAFQYCEVKLGEIKHKISLIQEDNQELLALRRYEEEYASQKYQQIADMYSNIEQLPIDQAKGTIREKIESFKAELTALDPDDPEVKSKTCLLRQEILKNLSQMIEVPDGRWTTELQANKSVWTKAAQITKDHTLTGQALAENERELERLARERNRLFKALGHP